MADKIDVDPTPIQRNTLDVAIELTQLYFQRSAEADIEKLDSIFARFYAAARILHSMRPETLHQYFSDDLKK